MKWARFVLSALLAAQSGARGTHAHLPKGFRMLYDLSYVGEVMLSTSEKSLQVFRRQQLDCKKPDGAGCTIGRIRQKSTENYRKGK